MLYNFNDTPADLYERMRLNIDLNEKLDIRIFSFPMRYQPTDLPDRSFVSENWNRYYLRSMQIILQATHGIVSGAPDFFSRLREGQGKSSKNCFCGRNTFCSIDFGTRNSKARPSSTSSTPSSRSSR